MLTPYTPDDAGKLVFDVPWLSLRAPEGLLVFRADGKVRGAARINNGAILICINPKERGKGYGTQAIREVVAYAETPLSAHIPIDNEISQRAFAAAGFTRVDDTTWEAP